MSDSRINLRPLTSADLPLITPWFGDPDTGRFLGGPEWPAQMLALAGRSAGTIFRGARQTGIHHYLALADDIPAGYIDCGTFDRCAVYGGEGPTGPIILETIHAVTGAIAFVIAPELRGRGLGRAMIAAMLARSELRDVELFEAGVEPRNTASRHCLEASGFELSSEQPDFDGMLYYRAWLRALIARGTGPWPVRLGRTGALPAVSEPEQDVIIARLLRRLWPRCARLVLVGGCMCGARG